jgi:predicted nucleic acid-binding protein
MTALDTNVIIDLASGETSSAEAALRAIESAAKVGGVVICGAVYGELCASLAIPVDEVNGVLASSGITIDADIPLEVWADAGTAFRAHALRCKKSGAAAPRRILTDFIIGAHACVAGSLVTRDAAFYRRAFPKLRVVEVR